VKEGEKKRMMELLSAIQMQFRWELKNADDKF